MDKATVTRLRSMDAQLKSYRTQLIEVKEDAEHPTDKHHIEKAREMLQKVQNHLKVAIIGLQDQVSNEKIEKGFW